MMLFTIDKNSHYLPGLVDLNAEIVSHQFKQWTFIPASHSITIEKKFELLDISEIPNYLKMLNREAVFHLYILWALVLEKLSNMPDSTDLNYIRMLFAELERFCFNVKNVGEVIGEAGNVRMKFRLFRERRRILSLLNQINPFSNDNQYIIPGGIREMLSVGFFETILKVLEKSIDNIKVLKKKILSDRLLRLRLEGVGTFSSQDAVDFGISGPNLWATGTYFDLRKTIPYLSYNYLDSGISHEFNSDGDVYSRIVTRLITAENSLELSRQICNGIYYDKVRNALSAERNLVLQSGEVLQCSEGPNGIIGIFLKIAETGKIDRFRYISPSANIASLFESKFKDLSFNDARLSFLSLGISPEEIER